MKRCSRCGGQLIADPYDATLTCLQCGHTPSDLVPLPIPARPVAFEVRESRRKPSVNGIEL